MTRKLTPEELERYDRDGYLVIRDAVPQERLRDVIAETERMYNVAYTIASGNEMLDVDPAHTPEKPRVRRIKSQHEHSEFFRDFAAEPLIMDLLEPLLCPRLEFQQVLAECRRRRHRVRAGVLRGRRVQQTDFREKTG